MASAVTERGMVAAAGFGGQKKGAATTSGGARNPQPARASRATRAAQTRFTNGTARSRG